MTAGVLHLVVPAGIDDPARPSGGNTYDRRLCDALRRAGWDVDLVEVDGGWPWDPALGAWHLDRALRGLPDGADVIVDGLLATRLPRVMLPAARRLRVVLLVHLPAGVEDASARDDERRVVRAATSVVTPSAWCRDWLVREHALDPATVRVAHPGVEPAAVSPGTDTGSSLLTVGSLAPVKGQDLLLLALDRLADVPWRWTCVGPDVDEHFAANLHFGARGLRDRIDFAGPLAGADVEAAYAGADLLVVPSRHESYGMVVTEALARGLPVVAHDVGGLREAIGATPSGALPGLVVRPGDPAALAAALRMWLSDADLRSSLRSRALERRQSLDGWAVAADRVAALVREVAA